MKNGSIDEKYHYVLKMFYVHYNAIYFTVHHYFPRDKLVKIFNIFGQEVTTEHKGMLIKLYRDGSVEKTLNNGRFN